jgi:hypothetical protein
VKRLATLALVTIALAGACSSGSSKTTAEKDWDPSGLQVAHDLQSKLVNAKTTCKQYQAEDYAAMSDNFARQGLPVPLAITNCLGDADEDLTTEVFADAATTQQFIHTKRKILCDASAKNKLTFPGFVYVDGGTWVFEPDKKTTADEVAQILGGRSKIGDCKGL